MPDNLSKLQQIPVSLRRLLELFPDAELTGTPPDLLMGLADDSRNVREGYIFVAIDGFETDGHQYLSAAVENGARLLVVERGHVLDNPQLLEPVAGVPLLRVNNTRRAAAVLASEFYAHPSRQLAVHGVTGTKGKSTTVSLTADILNAAGRKAAAMGTTGIEFFGKRWEMKLTTPGPIEFQEHLRTLSEEGATDVACEVSAHAGALNRTCSVNFQSVAFLNLYRDHLDHFTPDSYREAKMEISRDAVRVNPSVWGIGNARDPNTETFLEPVERSRRIRFAAFEEKEDPGICEAELRAQILSRTTESLRLAVWTADWRREVTLPLIGRFNAMNAAAAAAIALSQGIGPESIAEGLSRARPVAGRLERVDLGQGFLVIVDYAHAPEATAEVLNALREITPGRLISVMGAGGSRDRGKRPLMGQILVTDSDLVVITSDNPRKEEPLDIINDILTGVQKVKDGMKKVVVEPDRRKAIGLAIEIASDGDTVAILGKGHETYQIFKDKTIHFDDREVAREWLRERGYGG